MRNRRLHTSIIPQQSRPAESAGRFIDILTTAAAIEGIAQTKTPPYSGGVF